MDMVKQVVLNLKAKFLLDRKYHSVLKKGVLLVVTGDSAGSFLFKTNKNDFTSDKDYNSRAACTVTLSYDVLLAIMNGFITPQRAYLEKKIQVIGDLSCAFYFSAFLLS